MSVASMNNVDLWNYIRSKFPQFKSHTSKGTAELMSERGYEQLKNGDYPTAINDFFELSLRVFLQQVNVSRAVDQLFEGGFGEYYDNAMGGYIQRISVDSIKPITPAFKGLVDGSSVDPFIVRKPRVGERFWRQNFDYQSLVTIPDDFQMKQIFISEFGMSELMGGIMTGLENGYTVQLYENKLEALNAGINSVEFPLQDTQKINVSLSADPTAAELSALILAIRNTVDAMTLGPQNHAFNALKFNTVQDKSRLKLLLRPGIKNAIAVKLLANSYNIEELNLPIDIVEVPSFGGLLPYKTESGGVYSDALYPVYDTFGTVIGFSTIENDPDGADSEYFVPEDEVKWKDPNADVIGLIADKGYMFHSVQNHYRVEPIRNPRGLYSNFWCSTVNNTVAVDHIYNVVEIKNS